MFDTELVPEELTQSGWEDHQEKSNLIEEDQEAVPTRDRGTEHRSAG